MSGRQLGARVTRLPHLWLTCMQREDCHRLRRRTNRDARLDSTALPETPMRPES